jgi:hypothetical protein
MNTTSTLALALTVALATLVQEKKPDDTAQRLATVEQELAAHRRAAVLLTKEVGELRTLLDKTVRYVNEQSKAAETMALTLDASEKAGFTYGINPDSRTILLRGWRDALAAAQKDVPTPPAQNGTSGTNGAGGANGAQRR